MSKIKYSLLLSLLMILSMSHTAHAWNWDEFIEEVYASGYDGELSMYDNYQDWEDGEYSDYYSDADDFFSQYIDEFGNEFEDADDYYQFHGYEDADDFYSQQDWWEDGDQDPTLSKYTVVFSNLTYVSVVAHSEEEARNLAIEYTGGVAGAITYVSEPQEWVAPELDHESYWEALGFESEEEYEEWVHQHSSENDPPDGECPGGYNSCGECGPETGACDGNGDSGEDNDSEQDDQSDELTGELAPNSAFTERGNDVEGWDLFQEFLDGTGPEYSIFTDGHPMVEDLKQSWIVGIANAKFALDGQEPLERYDVPFGLLGIPTSHTANEQIIGGARVTIIPVNGGRAYIVDNTMDRYSFYYHLAESIPRDPETTTPEGTTYHRFIWFEN